jgi:hypothetical protein
MKHNDPPFYPIVNTHGYFTFTQEYMDWAVQPNNYPGSSLAIEDMGSDARTKIINGIEYVESVFPFDTREKAKEYVKKIQSFGGIATIQWCMRSKKKIFIIWYNPNGSHAAREYVSGW